MNLTDDQLRSLVVLLATADLDASGMTGHEIPEHWLEWLG